MGDDALVKLRNKQGRAEEFRLSKVIAECEDAGSTPYQAACVARELGEYVKDKSEITAEELSDVVSTELGKLNETTAKVWEERSEHGG